MISEFVEKGHFYSVIPEINKKFIYNNQAIYNNIDFNDNEHLKIINNLKNELINYDKYFGVELNKRDNYSEIIKKISIANSSYPKFGIINGSFEWMDGRMLFYFIKTLIPTTIIEIGCGNSTILMTEVNEIFNLNINIICIEPYPNKNVLKLNEIGKITLITEKLENVDINLFKKLKKNDILFIDSSHVVKINSDVMFYFNSIFPILNDEVYIHIHDIFLPYEYPESWIKEGRFWNEQYFLYNFLQFNSKFKIKFANNYASKKFCKELTQIQTDCFENKFLIDRNNNSPPFGGGSIWLLKNSINL